MSYKRHHAGRREREARKRHRRVVEEHFDGAGWRRLKLGNSHLKRTYYRLTSCNATFMCVDDSRNSEADKVKESPKQPFGFDSRPPDFDGEIKDD